MSETAKLLDALELFVRRFVVLSEAQAAAIALWIVHTHAFEAAETTPYLAVTSGMKRSGKTRLLEVAELLVREPLPTANISDAALFRAIGEKGPTLLMDEIDAVFGPKARDREDLRGMLNAGYRRGVVVYRMGGAKMNVLEPFPVFCAKAFAGIGALPDTITDRAITIRLERRTREEPVERFRRREADESGEPLHQWAVSWADQHVPLLAESRPELPDELDDRAQDIWEPLLAIADLAGGDWPARARSSALQLCGPEARQDEDDSLTALLLQDLHEIFTTSTEQRFRTSDLIEELVKIEESPWGDWHGKPITAQALSRLLRPFRIKTMPVWSDGKTVKGYKLEQFADAFHRVLGVRGVRTVRSGMNIDAAPNPPNLPNPPHAVESTNGRTPLPGDDDFLDFILAAHRAGHITTAEALECEQTNKLIQKA
jgi:Protein of unknown function (DUF3631)